MSKKFKVLSILLIWIVIFTSFTGCATFDNFRNAFFGEETTAETTVRIGVFEPLSGHDKESGELERTGIELAHELYPTALGKNVELIYADNKSDIYAAETAIHDLILKRPAVVLGSYGNVYSLIAAEYLEEAKIPAVAITNTNPLVTSNHPYYFRACFSDSFEGVAVAKYAVEELGVKAAAILKPLGDDYATAVSRTFGDKMIQLTQNANVIVSSQDYQHEESDFKAHLEKIKKSGAEVVFLPSKVEDAAKILKQAEELKVDAVFLGIGEWDTEELIELAGEEAAEGASFSTSFDAEARTTEMTEVFLKAYRERYGKDAVPSGAVALGFDAYILAVDALNRAGTALDGEKIKESMAMTQQFPGASGTITFDINGDPIKSVVIKTVHLGEIISKYTVEPTWVVLGE